MSSSEGGNRRASFSPAQKRLGQHFLTDPRLLARIADALELVPSDTVVEIGPGRGGLTEQLVARAGRVVAIELDRALAASLRQRYAATPSVRVIEGDVLSVPLAEAAGTREFALAGNVPYYITTPILFHALAPPRPSRAVYLVQREVADRLTAAPGTKEYGALTINVRAVANVERLFRIAPGAFQPPPSVDSTVVRITPAAMPAIADDELPRFRRFVQDAFGLRRKQMRRVLRTVTGLDPAAADELLRVCDVDPAARPEALHPAAFARLLRTLDARGGATTQSSS